MDLVVDFLKKRQNVRKITGFFKEKRGISLFLRTLSINLTEKGLKVYMEKNKLRKVGLTA